ncbi:MAG: hypothetical protein RID07_00685 [Lacipirellulaceae bacterium]
MAERIQRLTRRELYDLVWETPVDTLAKELGMSGRGLGKLCERNSIPVPPRGYWARKAAGYKVRRSPLLDVDGSRQPEVVIDLRFVRRASGPGPNDKDAEQSPYQEFFERQLREIGSIRVKAQIRNPHPMIAGWLKRETADRQQARDAPHGYTYFTAKHATSLGRRRLRILDALFHELERRGCKVEAEEFREDNLSIRLGRDAVEFTFSERIRQRRRRLTEEEKAGHFNPKQEWTQTKEPTGQLIFKLSRYALDDISKSWQDREDKPLEDQLPSVLAGLLTNLAYVREKREADEAARRRRDEREEEARKLETKRRAERDRKLGLRQRVKAWEVAARIRDYVAAVDTAVASDDLSAEYSTVEHWRTWALSHADEIDPLVSGDAMETDLLWQEEPARDSGYH